ncbi:MAG: TVP38/TMEM64 family protein [Pyrinomonadaceae bacterium]|nr:TVP38/TMEM64 family protein [Pyrinomonadaceae bacterium]
MKRYLLIVAATIAFFLTLFFAVQALGVPLLADPTPWMRQGGILAGILGVSLLIADVLLPVPSSLVMVAHGALFGVLKGTLLSLLGSMGAALVGFAIGRRGGKLLDRLVTPAERARADQMLARWGALAVALTRPVPLLAETTAIMAGASPLAWRRMALASLVGSLPPSLIYAFTGAAVVNFQSTAMMFGAVLLATGSFWVVGRLLDRYLSKRRNRRDAEQPDTNSDLKLAQE